MVTISSFSFSFAFIHLSSCRLSSLPHTVFVGPYLSCQTYTRSPLVASLSHTESLRSKFQHARSEAVAGRHMFIAKSNNVQVWSAVCRTKTSVSSTVSQTIAMCIKHLKQEYYRRIRKSQNEDVMSVEPTAQRPPI
jgi:hypothetical protein